jgi:hypothetical protein
MKFSALLSKFRTGTRNKGTPSYSSKRMDAPACLVCNDLSSTASAREGTRSALQQSVAGGCPICSFLLEAVSLIIPGWLEDEDTTVEVTDGFGSLFPEEELLPSDFSMFENIQRPVVRDATFRISHLGPGNTDLQVYYFNQSSEEEIDTIVFFTLDGTVGIIPILYNPFWDFFFDPTYMPVLSAYSSDCAF